MKFQDVRLIHYTSSKHQAIGWDITKKNSLNSYVNRPLNCEKLNPVDLMSIISVYKNTDMNNVFINCDDELPISRDELGMSKVISPSNDPKKILSAIESEIDLNKKSKTELNFFIYYSKPKELPQVKVQFNVESMEVEYGKEIKLKPVYNGNIEERNWVSSSSAPLSCEDCEYQKIKPTEDQTYIVQVSDADNCESDSDTIRIHVLDNCVCHTNETITRPIRSKEQKRKFDRGDEIFVNLSKSSRSFSEESLRANISGSPMYYYFMNEFCADSYFVELIDAYGNTVWAKKKYTKEALTTGNINKDYPGYFIFNLNFNNIKELIEDWKDNKAFLIKITPIDNKGVECQPYISVPTSISPCG